MDTLSEREKIIIGLVFLLNKTYEETLRWFINKIAGGVGQNELRIILKKLIKERWLISPYGNLYMCSYKVTCEFLSELLRLEKFLVFLDNCFKEVTEGGRTKGYYVTYSIADVELRLGTYWLLAHRFDLAEKLAEKTVDYYRRNKWLYSSYPKETIKEYYIRDMFAVMFTLDGADKVMLGMPKHIQLQQLPLWINYSIFYSRPLLEWRQLSKEGNLSEEQRRSFMALAFIEGDREAIGGFAQGGDKETIMLFEAYLNMLQGDWKTADARFTKFVNSMDLLKSSDGSFCDVVLSFSLIDACLAQAPNSRIVKWNDILQKRHYSPRHDILALDAAIADGKVDRGFAWREIEELADSSGYELTIYSLVNSYLLKPLIKPSNYPYLVEFARKLFDLRQNVLGVYLCSALANLLPGDTPGMKEIMVQMDKFQIARPVGAERKAPWEELLDALDGIDGGQDKPETEPAKQLPEGRIVWKLDTATAYIGDGKKWNVLYEIQMIYQRVLKRGGFSAGRVIYGDDLLSGKYDACLSEKERQVKNYITASVFSRLQHKALDCLVDSENVCVNSLDNPVKLVKDENVLQSTVKADGTVELTTRYPLRYHEKETLVDFSEKGICRYYRLGEKTSPLERIFDRFAEEGKLVIPRDGRARLQEAISRITRVMPVTGALMQEA